MKQLAFKKILIRQTNAHVHPQANSLTACPLSHNSSTLSHTVCPQNLTTLSHRLYTLSYHTNSAYLPSRKVALFSPYWPVWAPLAARRRHSAVRWKLKKIHVHHFDGLIISILLWHSVYINKHTLSLLITLVAARVYVCVCVRACACVCVCVCVYLRVCVICVLACEHDDCDYIRPFSYFICFLPPLYCRASHWWQKSLCILCVFLYVWVHVLMFVWSMYSLVDATLFLQSWCIITKHHLIGVKQLKKVPTHFYPFKVVNHEHLINWRRW